MLEGPLESLNGADLFLRASVLEEREGFGAARDAYALADERLYAPAVREARDRALAHVAAIVRAGAGRIVDVATGRGTLLELLAGQTDRPLVATDVSPTILERVRRRLGEGRIQYVPADVRALPFEDGSVPTLVSHLGLANVPEPRRALCELRRVGAELVATHVFYPEDDDANREVARGLGLDELLFRESALHAFEESGWKVEIETAAEVAAAPTPASALIEGVRIDALPAAPTRALWCVVHAR